jgi:hypothetical protein
LNLGVGKAALLGKFTVPRLRKPRRHVPAFRYRSDLGGVTLHVIVVEEGEGRRLPRAMTRRTVAVHDDSDLLVKRDGNGGDCGQGKRHEE